MTAGITFARLDGLSSVPSALRGGVVAIGNFDGCHRGHQQVFEAARAMAAKKGVPALVLSFEPHPRDVFAPQPFLYRLTYADQKAALVEALGFNAVAFMEFSRDLASVEAPDFVARYLLDALEVSGVVVGADFQFGKGRAGTPDFLVAQGEEHGFSVEICSMLDDGTHPVSSSRIREALAVGDVETANVLLGYHHIFSGVVVEGDKRGRELGYPTANMGVPDTFGLAQGVYAVKVRLDGEVFDGVAAYGKPMFDNTKPPFEAFIFNFDRTIYGEALEIALLGFIRGQMKFDGLEALIAQMDLDSDKARIITAQARPLSSLDAALGYFNGPIG
ncbi:bifunctional riboflavin kinase/FAD synthetase [Pelagibacterium sp.]|uniref:bifunctional riboflavin kinase/FAD synthetase n=1 Tax=Pelagibacterium sp. TaxID=1967288 RepID=UPI003A91076F